MKIEKKNSAGLDSNEYTQDIVFRFDVSQKTGYGHLKRCEIIGEEFLKRGLGFSSIIRESEDSKNKSKFKQNDFLSISEDLSFDEDISRTINFIKNKKNIVLIVDSYQVDKAWQQKIRKYVKKIIVLEDYPSRKHDCDILIDQTFNRFKSEYSQRVNSKCEVLTGEKYTLISKTYFNKRILAVKRRSKSKIKILLITMGGSDKKNFTSKVLEKLSTIDLNPNIRIRVIIGPLNKWVDTIKQKAKLIKNRVDIISDLDDLSKEYLNADACIGAGGMSSWERCYLGLPTIQIAIAKNQSDITDKLHQANAVIKLQNINKLDKSIKDLEKNYSQYSDNSFSIIDGKGAERVASAILKKI